MVAVRSGRELEIVDRSPIGNADDDDEHQPTRLDQRAEHIDPHRLADAAEHKAGEEQEKAESQEPEGHAFDAEQGDEIGSKHTRLCGDRGEPRAYQRQPHHEAEQWVSIRATGDVGGAGSARVSRAEGGIRQRGEQSGDQRDHKGEPQGIAGLAGGLADQSIDAGAEHTAEPVKRHLHRTDRAPQRLLLAR